MLNDVNVKNLRESLRYKFQLKQITRSREKVLQPMKTEKNELKISKAWLQPYTKQHSGREKSRP